MTMCDEFEEWYRSAWGDEPINAKHFRKDENDQYFSIHTHESWITWKASRESLVVEIPYPGHWTLDRDMVIEAIHAAGVRTK